MNITDYAKQLLLKTDFVDCYGRNIGLDYETILELIRARFPNARTTKRSLRFILYQIDKSARLPARRRSRKILRKEFIRALLLDPAGISHASIRSRARRKFPDVPGAITSAILAAHERALTKERFELPERRK
jgi:hypothetical protein